MRIAGQAHIANASAQLQGHPPLRLAPGRPTAPGSLTATGGLDRQGRWHPNHVYCVKILQDQRQHVMVVQAPPEDRPHRHRDHLRRRGDSPGIDIVPLHQLTGLEQGRLGFVQASAVGQCRQLADFLQNAVLLAARHRPASADLTTARCRRPGLGNALADQPEDRPAAPCRCRRIRLQLVGYFVSEYLRPAYHGCPTQGASSARLADIAPVHRPTSRCPVDADHWLAYPPPFVLAEIRQHHLPPLSPQIRRASTNNIAH